MKTIKKSLLAGAICASLGATAPALADVRTIIFEGNVEYLDFDTDREGFQLDNEESIVRFRAIATYDDDRMFYDEYFYMYWRDVYYEDNGDPEEAALVGLTFQFLDAMGNVVPQSSIPMEVNFEAEHVDESDFEFYQYYYDDGEFIVFDNEQVGSQDVGEFVSVDEGYDIEFDYREDREEEGGCSAEFEEDYNCGEYEYDFDVDSYNYMMMDPPLFTDTGTELEPVEYFGDGEFYFQFDFRQYDYIDGGESSYLEFYAEGEMDTIYFGMPDADADGVPDDVDQCSASLTEETVMFGEYDSSVTNYVDEQGCTIMDHYAACPEETSSRGIRSVRSGPSNCEKAISYELVSDGVITYSEARLLRSALYNSQ